MKKDINKTKDKPIEKNKGGRPTDYKESMNQQAYKLAMLGMTDQEIADFFEINRSTFYRWQQEYPKFKDSIHAGKIPADADVIASLHASTQDRMIPMEQAFKVKNVFYNAEGKRIESEKVEVVTVMQAVPANPQSIALWVDRRLRKNKTWQKETPEEVKEEKPTVLQLVLPTGKDLNDVLKDE